MYENKMKPNVRLREVLHILFKHKKKIIAAFLITMIFISLVTILATPIFQSSASLLVKIGREYRAKSENGSPSNQMVIEREEIINSEIEIMLNRQLISSVIKTVGLKNLYPELPAASANNDTIPDSAIKKFLRSLNVRGIPKSNVISIYFEHPNPVVANAALSTLIDRFREKHLEVYSDPVSPVLKQQLAVYAERLKNSEDALEDFRQRYRIYSIEEQRNLLLGQQIELDTLYRKIEAEKSELQRKILSSQAHLRDISGNSDRYTHTERDKIVVDAQTRLLGLQLKEQELLNHGYRSESRALMNLSNEIDLVKNFMITQEADIAKKVRTANPVYQQLENDLLKAQSDFVSKQESFLVYKRNLEDIVNAIQALDKRQNELHTLEREVKVNEKNYLTYQEKFEDARISADLNQQKIANISVVQPPLATTRPIRPSRTLNLLLGLLVSTLTALTVGLVAEYFSQTYSNPQQVARRLGIPILASIRLQS